MAEARKGAADAPANRVADDGREYARSWRSSRRVAERDEET